MKWLFLIFCCSALCASDASRNSRGTSSTATPVARSPRVDSALEARSPEELVQAAMVAYAASHEPIVHDQDNHQANEVVVQRIETKCCNISCCVVA
jgi:hypothetical protein